MDTKDKIAVMQAYVDGRAVQYKSSRVPGSWLCLSKDPDEVVPPLWNWEVYTYRIKPEPEVQVLYVNSYSHDDFCAYPTEARAIVAAATSARYVAKKFVAVEE